MRFLLIFLFCIFFITSCTTYDLSKIPECNFTKQMPFNCVSLTYNPFQKTNLSNAICKYQTEFHDEYICYEDLNEGWFKKNNTVKQTDNFYCYNVPSNYETYCDIITLPSGENITQNCWAYPVQNVICVPKQNVTVRRNVKINR